MTYVCSFVFMLVVFLNQTLCQPEQNEETTTVSEKPTTTSREVSTSRSTDTPIEVTDKMGDSTSSNKTKATGKTTLTPASNKTAVTTGSNRTAVTTVSNKTAVTTVSNKTVINATAARVDNTTHNITTTEAGRITTKTPKGKGNRTEEPRNTWGEGYGDDLPVTIRTTTVDYCHKGSGGTCEECKHMGVYCHFNYASRNCFSGPRHYYSMYECNKRWFFTECVNGVVLAVILLTLVTIVYVCAVAMFNKRHPPKKLDYNMITTLKLKKKPSLTSEEIPVEAPPPEPPTPEVPPGQRKMVAW